MAFGLKRLYAWVPPLAPSVLASVILQLTDLVTLLWAVGSSELER